MRAPRIVAWLRVAILCALPTTIFAHPTPQHANPGTALVPRNLTALPPAQTCNASCIHSLLRKTSYASAAVGVALTLSEYDSLDWCMSHENIGWCPPTIEATLDVISVNVATLVRNNQSKTNDCDVECLRTNMEAVSRRAAAVSMLWAKLKVGGGRTLDVGSKGGPDGIDWSIYLLAGNRTQPAELEDEADDVSGGKVKRGLWRWMKGKAHDGKNPKANSDGKKPHASDEKPKAQKPTAAEPKSAKPEAGKPQAQTLKPETPKAEESPAKQQTQLWEPRMSYLVKTSFKLRNDPWLRFPAVRKEFTDVLKSVYSAKADVHNGWLKYMIKYWLIQPPTSKPEQYHDFAKELLHLEMKVSDYSADLLDKIHRTKVNETVWRWVEDTNPSKVMDPWEGIPDSGRLGPDAWGSTFRGMQMQFNSASSPDPVRENTGGPSPGPAARSVFTYERTLFPPKDAVDLRRVHFTPLSYQGDPKPDWKVMDKYGKMVAGPDGGEMKVHLEPGTVRPKTDYRMSGPWWGNKLFLPGNDTASSWCDGSCYRSTLHDMSWAAAKAGTLAAAAIFEAEGWCFSPEHKDSCPMELSNITALAARAGIQGSMWKGQQCLDRGCQRLPWAIAAYRAEAVAMRLSKIVLLPSIKSTGLDEAAVNVTIDGTIAERQAHIRMVDPTENLSKPIRKRSPASSQDTEASILRRQQPPAKPDAFPGMWSRLKSAVARVMRKLTSKLFPKSTERMRWAEERMRESEAGGRAPGEPGGPEPEPNVPEPVGGPEGPEPGVSGPPAEPAPEPEWIGDKPPNWGGPDFGKPVKLEQVLEENAGQPAAEEYVGRFPTPHPDWPGAVDEGYPDAMTLSEYEAQLQIEAETGGEGFTNGDVALYEDFYENSGISEGNWFWREPDPQVIESWVQAQGEADYAVESPGSEGSVIWNQDLAAAEPAELGMDGTVESPPATPEAELFPPESSTGMSNGGIRPLTDAEFKGAIERLRYPWNQDGTLKLATAENPDASDEEFVQAAEAGDPVAEAQLPAVDSPGIADPFMVAAETGLPEEATEEVLEESAVVPFLGIEGLDEAIEGLSIFLPIFAVE